MDREELRQIAASVGPRRGWDLSRVRLLRDTTPWDYSDVVCRYLKSTSRVLDVGTGSGESLLAMARHFGKGTGVDVSADMIAMARENLLPGLASRIAFKVTAADHLEEPDCAYDSVLCRHAPVNPAEVVRVLRPEGYFITQQIGARNTRNIGDIFGCTAMGTYASDPDQTPDALARAFEAHGCDVIARGVYDVRCWLRDIESLLFWLQAVPMPHDFSIERHWREVNAILDRFNTPRGIETNEAREMLIVRKGA
jgi:SAM-dependent methyltransferase